MHLRPPVVVIVALSLWAGLALAQPEAEQPLLPGLDIAYHTQVLPGWPRNQDGYALWGHDVTFSPDGWKMCYSRLVPPPRDSYVTGLWDVREARSLVGDLVREFEYTTWPAMSPDGRELLFLGVPRVPTPGRQVGRMIWRTDLAGSTPERMTPDWKFDATSPTWAPDGHTIAFAKVGRQDPETGEGFEHDTIAFIRSDQPQKIVRELKVTTDLDFRVSLGRLLYSPDGRWIACSPGSRASLAVIQPDTGRLHPLFNRQFTALSVARRALTDQGATVWLPDSRRLLVSVVVGDEIDGYFHRIWMVNLAGETRQLGDGKLLGGTLDGRVVFVEKAGQIYRVDFD